MEKYKNAFTSLMQDATRQAQQTMTPALSCLREILEDPKEQTQSRVLAARSVLEYALKLTEQIDIMERLSNLESAVKEDYNP